MCALNLRKPTPRTDSAPTPAAAIHRSNGNQSLSSSFQPASKHMTHRLIVDAGGEEKSGKSHFAFTAPGPIYEHSFDIGNEGVIDKFMDKKQIFVADYGLDIQPGEAPDKEVAEAACKVWDQFVANFKDGLASCGNGTTYVDTISEAWQLCRLARFGRLTQIMPHNYTVVNAEMRDLIRECYDHDANVVFTSQMKPEWENYTDSTGKEKGKKTGRMVRSGFSDMPYLVQINLQCFRTDKPDGGSDFNITIEDCRQNPNLNGLTLDNDFETLLNMVFMD
jgi:hypothetical protein